MCGGFRGDNSLDLPKAEAIAMPRRTEKAWPGSHGGNYGGSPAARAQRAAADGGLLLLTCGAHDG